MTNAAAIVLKSLPRSAAQQAAECLRTLAHPDRIQLVRLLLHDRFPVGQLATLLDLAPHVTSEHLRLMERCGLLGSERRGRNVYYQVCEPHLAAMIACIEERFSGPDANASSSLPSQKESENE